VVEEPEQHTADYDAGFRDGLRAAREAVGRQTNLPDLVHFDRPSDFRKGVLSCVVAIDNVIPPAEGRTPGTVSSG